MNFEPKGFEIFNIFEKKYQSILHYWPHAALGTSFFGWTKSKSQDHSSKSWFKHISLRYDLRVQVSPKYPSLHMHALIEVLHVSVPSRLHLRHLLFSLIIPARCYTDSFSLTITNNKWIIHQMANCWKTLQKQETFIPLR